MIDKFSAQATRDHEISFEQPLTERTRTFLKIEFLYEQARFHIENSGDYSARAGIAGLLEILAILGRGDVRAEVLKELERQMDVIAQFRRSPGVDTDRLNALMDDLSSHKNELAAVGSQFLQPLRDCDFLSAIKHRSAIPGGTCTFDVPDYGFWLQLPYDTRTRQLVDWMRPLTPLCTAVCQLLWLTRESAEPVNCVAASGFYQSNLDRGSQLNLLRVHIPRGTEYYPEISAGRHRFTVRFVRWKGVDARPVQVDEDVKFRLTLS